MCVPMHLSRIMGAMCDGLCGIGLSLLMSLLIEGPGLFPK